MSAAGVRDEQQGAQSPRRGSGGVGIGDSVGERFVRASARGAPEALRLVRRAVAVSKRRRGRSVPAVRTAAAAGVSGT
eukprot:ctg_2427.g556